VLISSDFKTGFKIKKVFNMYVELSQSRWLTDCAKNKKFVKFTSDALGELQKRYEGPVAL